MNRFDRMRRMIHLGFALVCLMTLGFLVMRPGSPTGAYLILLCMFAGYGTYLYSKDLKRKSMEIEKKKMTPVRKRRRRLLEREMGKVIEFPDPHTAGHMLPKSKKK